MLEKTSPKPIQASVVYNPLDVSDRTDAQLVYQHGKSLTSYIKGLPEDIEWNVALDGVAIPKAGLDFTFPKPGSNLIVSPVPEGGGGQNDGKAILALVATVALSVFAPIAGAKLATAMSLGGSKLAVSLATAAVSIAGGVLISAMIPPPEETAAAEQSYGIDGAKNTSTEGVTYPVLYGEHAFGGNFIDIYTENTTDENGKAIQYLYTRTLVSEGPIDSIGQIYLNDQPIENFEDYEIDYRLGYDNQSISPWFTETVSLFNQGIDLTPNWATYTTSQEVDKIRIDLVAPAGIGAMDNKGRKVTLTVDCEVEYSKTGQNDWQPILANGVWVEKTNDNEFTTGLKIAVQSDPYFVPDRGDPTPAAPIVQYRLKGSLDAWQIIPRVANIHSSLMEYIKVGLPMAQYEVQVSSGSYRRYHKTAGPITISDNSSELLRRTFKSEVLEEAVYDVRYRRLNDEATLPDGWNTKVIASDIGEIKLEPLSLPYTAWLGLKIKMTGQINSIPTVTGVGKGRILTIYDHNGDIVEEAYSKNPADIALDAYMHTRYGGQLEAERIDFAAFSEWRDYCTANNLTFDGIFYETSNIDDALKHIYIAGRAQRISSGAKLSVAIDRAESPTMMFGDGNIKANSMQITYLPFADRINDLEIAFNDKNDQYRRRAVRVTNDFALNRGEPLKTSAIELRGIVDQERALREGTFRMNANRLIRRTAVWESPLEAVGCSVGDVVVVQHKMPGWGKGGRLLPASSVSTLVLDQDVTFEYGKEYRVLVHQNKKTRLTGVSVTSQTGNLVTLNQAIDANWSIDRLTSVSAGVDLAILRVIDSTTLLLAQKAGDIDLSVVTDASIHEADYIEDVEVSNPATISASVTTDTINLILDLGETPGQYSNFIFGEVQFTKKPFRIKSITRSADNEVSLTGVEYVEEVYLDDPQAQAHNYSSLTSADQVKNLTVEEKVVRRESSNVSYAVARWEQPENGVYTSARVQASINGEAYTTVAETSGTRYEVQAEKGDVVRIRVLPIVFGTINTVEPGLAPVATLTIQGVTIASAAPVDWFGVAGVRSVTLAGPAPSDENSFSHFDIYAGIAASEFVNATKVARSDSSVVTRAVPSTSTDARYWIVEVDTNGNVSNPSLPIDVVPQAVQAEEIEDGAVTGSKLSTTVTDSIAAAQTLADGVRTDHDALVAGAAYGTLAELEVDYAATQAKAQEAIDAAAASESFKNASEAAKTAAEVAKTAAQTQATNAANSATASAGSATSAGTAETNAGNSATAASAAQTSAETARDDAQTAASASASSATAAAASETQTGQDAAATASDKTAAQTAKAAAETARDQSVTARDTANSAAATATTQATNAANSATDSGNSAGAAATSASTATTKASEAATSATSANTSKNTATTKAGEASTSASNAATSASNAAGSATTATTQAGVATTAATNANNSANAAATSASTATSKATEASNSATAAESSNVSARSERDLIVGLSQDPYFERGIEICPVSTSYNGENPVDHASWNDPNKLTYVAGTDTEVGGQDLLVKSYQALYFKQTHAFDATKRYRIRFRVACDLEATDTRLYLGINPLNSNFGTSRTSGNPNWYIAASNENIPSDGVFREFTAEFDSASLVAGSFIDTKYIRLLALVNYSATNTGNVSRVSMAMIEDITDSYNAQQSASAAATSASTATTKASEAASSASTATTQANTASTKAGEAATSASQAATSATNASGSASTASTQASNAANSATAAGNSASAASSSASTATTKASEASTSATSANTSKNTATTKAAEASTSATNAATSATTASSASATAVSARDTAVAVASQGGGVLNDMFLPYAGGNNWYNWSAAPTIIPNEMYPTGNTFEWNIGAVNAGAAIRSDYTAWTGPEYASAFRVEIDFELVSGSLDGAGIYFLNYTLPSGSTSKLVPLSDMLTTPVKLGERMKASTIVTRDSTLDVNYNLVYMMANYSPLGPLTAKHIKVHSCQFYPINSTEASVQTLETAVVDLQGNASATYSFRVDAGSAGALLELIASDDPSGAASIARIAADNILLDGSVTVAHLDAGVLLADNITAGTMSVARIEVDEVLSIDAINAGFAMGKQTPYNLTDDGVYMGRADDGAGGLGFGFAVSLVNGTSKESLQITSQTGLKISNAQFYRDLAVPSAVSSTTTSQTVTLSATDTVLDVEILGGGGGGGGTTQGAAGGTTTVVLKDGATTIATWTATGGAGSGGGVYTAAKGQSSQWGAGGAAGTEAYSYEVTEGSGKGEFTYVVNVPASNGQPGAGSGAGGGAYRSNYLGGAASIAKAISGYDISGLTAPTLVITIGAGGAGSGGGGTGSGGRVDYSTSSTTPYRADVIPIEATATGSFYNNVGFPDLGAGFWVITTGVAGTGNTHTIYIDDTGQQVSAHYDSTISFVSTKTPVLGAYGANRLWHYKFHKMGA